MFITCDIACHRMCVACGLHVFRMSSHVSCMWITCVSHVIACELHVDYMSFACHRKHRLSHAISWPVRMRRRTRTQ